jgi:bifunctional UDP-N-acetylglucosamine pyrophosphorylase/glucosamine-1-phosphate N-acetyltransferase
MKNMVNIVIMAAGHGKRMNADRPKPLVALGGKPMVQYILDAVQKSGVCENPILVVSQDNKETFIEILGSGHTFAVQKEQLGTGHAVKSACHLLDRTKPTIVLNGDHPMISAEMIQQLTEDHISADAVITMGVVTVPHFDDWYSAFSAWGRVVCTNDGHIEKIIEAKDATPEQLKIRDVNPTYFCLKTDWMMEHLERLNNNNAQQEYYLTDLVRMAVEQGQKIVSSPVTPEEGIGINTPEHREMAERILLKKS